MKNEIFDFKVCLIVFLLLGFCGCLISENKIVMKWGCILMICSWLLSLLHPRKKEVRVVGTNLRGRSGRTTVLRDKLRSLWKKTWVLRCNSFNRRHSASCPSHWLRQFITRNRPIARALWSQRVILLHRIATILKGKQVKKKGKKRENLRIGVGSMAASCRRNTHGCSPSLVVGIGIAIKVRCHSYIAF